MQILDKQIHQLGELFEKVQLSNIFPDGKTFPDCIPNRNLGEIERDFHALKNNPSFDLKKFVYENFSEPSSVQQAFETDPSKDIQSHIHSLWNYLTRNPTDEKSSIIKLPKPYVVPGGRFREIYYWDSYFTQLGLLQSNRGDLAMNMLDNFSYLIDQFGYIPNGNRTYFLGRSQPPFFSLMVQLLADKLSNEILLKYKNHLEKEYSFWMHGVESLSNGQSAHRVVKLDDGSILNRYWDENDTPRPESYKEDIELSHQSKQNPPELFRNLRAAAESGWDFSSRWFADGKSFETIQTTEILPVDLNCLLYNLELALAKSWKLSNNESKVQAFQQSAEKRKSAIEKYCWDSAAGFYFDYDFKNQKRKSSWTLAGAFPLFVSLASNEQAKLVGNVLIEKFLKPGGLSTTLIQSGQQWDAPNGWAPLQWICYKGLYNYGLNVQANKIKSQWLTTNKTIFEKTGKLTEKYDVWNPNTGASGGEYPNQDGFGWTNGVFLAMSANL